MQRIKAAAEKAAPALFYLIIILYLTLFSRSASWISSHALSPFASYMSWLRGNGRVGVHILLNIAMFVPMGFYLSDLLTVLGRKKRRMLLVTAAGLLLSLSIETVQRFTGRGMFDVDDLISNTIGAAAGGGLYELSRFLPGSRQGPGWRRLLSAAFLLAGTVACLNIHFYTAGEVNSRYILLEADEPVWNGEAVRLQGVCRVKGQKDPDYRIRLKAEETGKVIEAATVTEGDRFHAAVDADLSAGYEIEIKLRGYGAIPLGIYLRDGKLAYEKDFGVQPDVSGTDLESIVRDGQLKVWEPGYEVFVYQRGEQLYWLIGADIEKDTNIICHLYTTETELLPEGRQQSGFDNIDIRTDRGNELTDTMRCGKYRVFLRNIPTQYPVTVIRTGFSLNGSKLWLDDFRPTPDCAA